MISISGNTVPDGMYTATTFIWKLESVIIACVWYSNKRVREVCMLRHPSIFCSRYELHSRRLSLMRVMTKSIEYIVPFQTFGRSASSKSRSLLLTSPTKPCRGGTRIAPCHPTCDRDTGV
jgi:hypothetical protein